MTSRGALRRICEIAALLAAACGAPAAPSQVPQEPRPAEARAPAPPVPIEDPTRGCKEAAVGLERGTRGFRPPEASVLGPMRALCAGDAWPAVAVACFAQMRDDDFGRCAAMLAKTARNRLFDRVGGGADDRIAIASALAQLSGMQVGIAECDQFIEAVAHVLVCDALAVDVRAQLGSETAGFWSLPTSGLPADAALRMADVCGRSRIALEQQAADAGCAP